jgi:hypothetical protein
MSEINPWAKFGLKLKASMLTTKQKSLVWKRMSKNNWFLNYYTDMDILKMGKEIWNPPEISLLHLMEQLKITRKQQKHIFKMIRDFPPLEESFLVLPNNLKRLASMTQTEAVFETKLSTSVLKNSVIAKMRILFTEKRALFLTLDYNIHKIAAEHFPDIPPIKTKLVKNKSAYNMFLNDKWEKEPENLRRTISPEIFSWCETQNNLWVNLPAVNKDEYQSRANLDKLRYRYELFKCLNEGKIN